MSHYSDVLSQNVSASSTVYTGETPMVGSSESPPGSSAAIGTWSQALTPPSTAAEYASRGGSYNIGSSSQTFTGSQYHQAHQPARRQSGDVLRHDYGAHDTANDCSSPTCAPDYVHPNPAAQPTARADHLSSSSLQSVCSTDSVFSDSILTPPCGMPTLLSHPNMEAPSGHGIQHVASVSVHGDSHEGTSGLSTKLGYSQSSAEVMRHSMPYSASAPTDVPQRYHHSAHDEYNPQPGVLNSFVATGQQVSHASPPPNTTQAYFANGLSNARLHGTPSYPNHPPPASPTSLQFVPYTLDRMHQFDGNISPLQQNRQRTQPLRDWLFEHRHHPYPGKADRDLLALRTHQTPDQVSMWFANTRRRIKKIGMRNWSNGRYSDSDFHAKSLPSTSGRSSSR